MKNILSLVALLFSIAACTAAPFPILTLVIPTGGGANPNGTEEVQSGATLTIDPGATIINNGTATGFGGGGSTYFAGTGLTLTTGTFSLASGAAQANLTGGSGTLNLGGYTLSLVSSQIPNNAANTTGNAATATSALTSGTSTFATTSGTATFATTAGSAANLSNTSQLYGTTGTTSISGTGTTTLTATGPVNSNAITFGAGTGTYTSSIVLSDAGVTAGQLYEITTSVPASTNPVITFYDGSTAGSIISPLPTNGTAGNTTLSFINNGTSWARYPKGAPLAYRNLSDMPSPTTSAQNLGIPFLIGPTTENILTIGDSITEAPEGLPNLAASSYAANLQYLGLGQAGAVVYDLGFRTETTGQILAQVISSGAVTTSIATTINSSTGTFTNAAGISSGWAIGSANTAPNTTFTLSGSVATLSQPATSTGTVTCSVAAAPVDSPYGELYPGGSANNWMNFSGTAQMLSTGITGKPTAAFILAGANDNYESTGASFTVTGSTTLNSPNVTITAGTFTGIVFGNVFTGTPFSSTTPPYVASGAGTSNVVLANPNGTPALATSTGSFTITVHVPITAFATYQSQLSSLVSTLHGYGDLVYVGTLIPAGNNSSGGQGAPIAKTFYALANSYILANSFGADGIWNTASCLPANPVTGSPLYYTDILHLSFKGTAVLAQYLNSQFLVSAALAQSNQMPFGVGQAPDQWLSSNIPRLNASNTFNPYATAVATTISVAAGSTTGTFTGTTQGIAAGMYIESTNGQNLIYPYGTLISTITGNVYTTSLASGIMASNNPAFLSYISPAPNSTVILGNLRIGPQTSAASIGQNGNVVFNSAVNAFNSGILWAGQQSTTVYDSIIGNTTQLILSGPSGFINIASGTVTLSNLAFNTGGGSINTGGGSIIGVNALTGNGTSGITGYTKLTINQSAFNQVNITESAAGSNGGAETIFALANGNGTNFGLIDPLQGSNFYGPNAAGNFGASLTTSGTNTPPGVFFNKGTSSTLFLLNGTSGNLATSGGFSGMTATGTNTQAADTVITSGIGTGTATSAAIEFQVTSPTTTGTVTQTKLNAARITPLGGLYVGTGTTTDPGAGGLITTGSTTLNGTPIPASSTLAVITVQTGTLVGGTSTKTVPAGCHPWVQDNASSLTNVGSLTVTVSGTTATITSTNVLDTSPYSLFNSGSQ